VREGAVPEQRRVDRREVAVAVGRDPRPPGQELEQDGAARTGEAGDVERPIDRNLVELGAVRAALEIAELLPETRGALDEAAQRIEPARHLERSVAAAGLGHGAKPELKGRTGA
jgi:hypothetical protein